MQRRTHVLSAPGRTADRWRGFTGLAVLAVAALVISLLPSPAGAQDITLGPDFVDDYTVIDLGTPDGVPTPLGGLTIKRGDPNTLLIGGSANAAAGAIYEVPLTRSADGTITGFAGPAVQIAVAPRIDGGLTYAPGSDVLLFTTYNDNRIGQILPGQAEAYRFDELGPLGVATSVGSLSFVPTGSPGAGSLKVVAYPGGAFFDLPHSPDGAGGFTFGQATQQATVPGGPEGIAYVPAGSPGFAVPSVLVAEYSANRVGTHAVDSDGAPDTSSRRDFLLGLDRAEGAYLDRMTGEFLFSTWTGGNRVVVVRGFADDAGNVPGQPPGPAPDPGPDPGPAPDPGPDPGAPPRPGEPGTIRIEGTSVGDPIDVADQVCSELTRQGRAQQVALARVDEFADALAGSQLPDLSCILFTDGGPTAPLNPRARAAIDRALVSGGVIHILGGTNAVSQAVSTELQGAGYDVRRLWGQTRFETAEVIAQTTLSTLTQQGIPSRDVVVAYGLNWPDAITAGAWVAARPGALLVLSDTTSLHPAARRVIDQIPDARPVLVGGDGVLGPQVAAALPGHIRVAGVNRMATAIAVARDLWPAIPASGQAFVFVNLDRSDAWTLALSAAPTSAAFDAPQMGVRSTSLPAETEQYLIDLGLTTIPSRMVLGDLSFVDDDVVRSIEVLTAG